MKTPVYGMFRIAAARGDVPAMEGILAAHWGGGLLGAHARSHAEQSRPTFDVNTPLDGFTSLHAAAVEGQAGEQPDHIT
jgi:hypothetical protein